MNPDDYIVDKLIREYEKEDQYIVNHKPSHKDWEKEVMYYQRRFKVGDLVEIKGDPKRGAGVVTRTNIDWVPAKTGAEGRRYLVTFQKEGLKQSWCIEKNLKRVE